MVSPVSFLEALNRVKTIRTCRRLLLRFVRINFLVAHPGNDKMIKTEDDGMFLQLENENWRTLFSVNRIYFSFQHLQGTRNFHFFYANSSYCSVSKRVDHFHIATTPAPKAPVNFSRPHTLPCPPSPQLSFFWGIVECKFVCRCAGEKKFENIKAC